jgi:mannosylfructose-phosphate synthase
MAINNKKSNKKIKRICMVNPQGYFEYPAPLGKTDTGGQTVYVLQLAKALGKKNIKVDIITRKFNDMVDEEQIFPNVKIVRIPCGPKTFVQKEKMYEIMPEFVENFMQYIEKSKKEYDIIHSHYWDGGYAGYLIAKMLDIPHVYTPHSLGKLKKIEMQEQIEEMPLKQLKPVYRYHVRIAIEQKIMNSADSIIAICETTRIQILQHYLVDFEKIAVIYPGTETETFNTKETQEDAKLNLGKNVILTVSRMVPAKGLDRIIGALATIKNDIGFHLYIAGETIESLEERSKEEIETEIQIKELIKKHKMEKMITPIGYVPHETVLSAYYRQSDIFVLAGRYEPFGLTTLEAMACGTVPIVSSVAGSREVIIDGLNGFVVDTHDRKLLGQKILQLLKDQKLRKKVSDNAAFTIKEHYSWDKIVEKFIKLYASLI